MGGILRVAGIDGFLANVKRTRRDSDNDLAQLRAFTLAWAIKYGTDKVGVKDLFSLLEDNDDLLPNVMMAETTIGCKQKLGHYLKKVRDRCLGQFQIRQLDAEDHSGRKQYRLKNLKETESEQLVENAPTAGASDQTEYRPTTNSESTEPPGPDDAAESFPHTEDESEQELEA
jgi:hypothetical protein